MKVFITFWMIEIQEIFIQFGPNKFTIAPGDKKKSDTTCCTHAMLHVYFNALIIFILFLTKSLLLSYRRLM
jgi:hypothetical protein